MKITVPCFFRICSNSTEEECLSKGVFGGAKFDEANLKSVDKGHLGFLYNAQKNSLIGVFAAEGKAGYGLVPGAFKGEFPLHVKVQRITGDVARIENACGRLEKIIKMKKSKNGTFYYFDYPVHGPDITEKILKLFFGSLDELPGEVKDFLSLHDELAGEPGKIIDDSFVLDSVVGLDAVKEFIRKRIIAPANDPERADKFKLRLGGGILLYGPSGTGKTLIARAISGEIQAKFFEITPSFIMGYPGVAEDKLEKLFNSIARQPRAVLFIDEAEWILKTRENQSSSVMERVTPVLLSELSELFKQRDRQIIIIAATNEPQKIDKAFLRPGRFGNRLFVGLPNADERLKIIKLNLKERAQDMTEKELQDVSGALEGYSGADIAHIADEAAFKAFDRKGAEQDHITKDDFMNIIASTTPSVSDQALRKLQAF